MAAPTIETYSEKTLPAFTPMSWSLKEIRAAIPRKYFVRNMSRGLSYFARDLLMAIMIWSLAATIDPYFQRQETQDFLTPLGSELARWVAWGVYWWFQGLIFTGIWVIGHECGHGAFSDYKIINDVLGFVSQTDHTVDRLNFPLGHPHLSLDALLILEDLASSPS
ncbi:hypothetical protein C0993_010558 [Termitomyces sp. T159_Od127]|nr:hypothetical protein C0993_010558 [Termitomyces sp. T159_Od127]